MELHSVIKALTRLEHSNTNRVSFRTDSLGLQGILDSLKGMSTTARVAASECSMTVTGIVEPLEPLTIGDHPLVLRGQFE